MDPFDPLDPDDVSAVEAESILHEGAASTPAPPPARLLQYMAARIAEADRDGDVSARNRRQIALNLVKAAYPSVHTIEHRILFDQNPQTGTEFKDFSGPYRDVQEGDFGGSGPNLPGAAARADELDQLVSDWLTAADDRARVYDEFEVLTGLVGDDSQRAAHGGAPQMIMDFEQDLVQNRMIADLMRQSPLLPPVYMVGEESVPSEWNAIQSVEPGDYVVAKDPIDGSTLAQATGQNYAVIYIFFEEV